MHISFPFPCTLRKTHASVLLQIMLSLQQKFVDVRARNSLDMIPKPCFIFLRCLIGCSFKVFLVLQMSYLDIHTLRTLSVGILRRI
jgi:hypothetical protein